MEIGSLMRLFDKMIKFKYSTNLVLRMFPRTNMPAVVMIGTIN